MTVVVALATVTLVMNPLLIVGDSFASPLVAQSDPLRAVVSLKGARREQESRLPAALVDVVKRAPEIARLANGMLMADAEIDYSLGCLSVARGKNKICATLIGMEPAGFIMHAELKDCDRPPAAHRPS